MTSIANLTTNSAALAPVNVHPHGHKKGAHLDPTTDSSSDTAAQVPAATAQNLFGSLLQSLEQVIGLQTTPVSASVTTAASPTTAGPPSTNAASAVPAANSLLQNYLNNLRNLQTNDSTLAKLAGANVRVSA